MIDALIPLADEIMGHGSEAQQDRLQEVIGHVADLAIGSEVLVDNVRATARALRLIYTGDDRGLEDGFAADALSGSTKAEQLALEVLVLMSVPQ